MRLHKPFILAAVLMFHALLVTRAAEAEPEAATPPPPSGRLHLEAERTLSAPVEGTAALPPIQVTSSYVSVDGESVTVKSTLLTQGFEGSFPGSTWTLFNQGTDAGWGKSTRRKSQGNASGWCAQTGAASPAPGHDVPNNMESWMVAGPFDLTSVSSGSLAFDLFLDTEPGDFFYVGASTAYPSFTVLGLDQDTVGFERFVLDLKTWGSLGDLTGKSQVWFAFLYQTDASRTGEGAYLDEILLDVDSPSGLNLLVNQVDAGDCPTMNAFVSVTDDLGNPITGLQSQNFTLSENGHNRTVTSQPASGSGEALAATLVLDGSGSLSNADVANIKIASKQFIDLLQSGDSVAVYHFGSDVELVRDYTTNHNAAKAAVDALTNGLGQTSLYDAIVEAANHSLAIGGRRALLVMTDGVNNDSVSSEQDAIAAALAAGVPVFTIGFGGIDAGVLQRIADQTGGLFFRGVDSGDLLAILNRISQTLGQQYVLAWTADQVDGGTHSVTIGVKRQGQTATRTTTYSQAGTPCATAGSCTANATTLCLNQDRFRVRVKWTDFAGTSGSGQVAPCGADDSGIFWFFADDNWEMLVKVLDGCDLTDHYWVFFAATTTVRYELTVTDTHTGATKRYTNPLGVASPAITDTAAFATCP